MNIQKKYIVIASVATVAVLIATIVTVVILVSRKGPEPAPKELYKQCDGLLQPRGNFNFTCPSIAEAGYCVIDSRFSNSFNVEFTLDKNYDKLDCVLTGPIDSYSLKSACDYIACPVEAGWKHKMDVFFQSSFFKRSGFGQIKFKLLSPDEEIYCVEFPVLIY